MGVLKIFDNSLAEQVIEAPKITLQDRVPHRAALRLPQLAEQLVEVPVPSARDCVIKETLSSVVLARCTDAAGQTWCHCSGARGLYWWLWGTQHTPSGDPQRESPPAQGGIQILGKAEEVVDVSVNMQRKFQQSMPIDIQVPQILFIARVLDFLLCH